MADSSKQPTDYLEIYASFSRNVRAWLIAYGVGAPVLLVSQDSVVTRLSNNPLTPFIAIVFLTGVLVQICSAIFYKGITGKLYMVKRGYHDQNSTGHDFSERWFKKLKPELICDSVTVVFYFAATALVIWALWPRS